jgi:hypothetical protein
MLPSGKRRRRLSRIAIRSVRNLLKMSLSFIWIRRTTRKKHREEFQLAEEPRKSRSDQPHKVVGMSEVTGRLTV